MQPGELLRLCAGATKVVELEEALIKGSPRLFKEHRDEFRLALTELLQREPALRQELVTLAETAVAKVKKVREGMRRRTWRHDATEGGRKPMEETALKAMLDQRAKVTPDADLNDQVGEELKAVKAGYQQELHAVLAAFKTESDALIMNFAKQHLMCMCNARAVVDHATSFVIDEHVPGPADTPPVTPKKGGTGT